ncbi:hypothetical protein GV794_05175 [Nocardia cyriacigeorgica]|uniref:Uncharacterized protein n=1 Tax=Nocardia cyriacigeorgica TaxID=135487 RepID=A0A6P1D106_9NOCA|nr:hypothetical protein [Nocardia cyriacigeorgica]NEW43249.1 hypothetical protein [Nocardia cyriacigeorgica]NEW48956.1 hypothetical protein [Nocardia cyriacigeorgica]NEW55057.1 hypothetical protein [Nocardia cyriacigeorgica]
MTRIITAYPHPVIPWSGQYIIVLLLSFGGSDIDHLALPGCAVEDYDMSGPSVWPGSPGTLADTRKSPPNDGLWSCPTRAQLRSIDVMADNHGYRTSGWSSSAILSVLHFPITSKFVHGLTELRYTGIRTRRDIALPVGYARRGDEVVVRVSRPEAKTWWRNFVTPAPLSLWIDGRWRHGTARVLAPGSRGYTYAAAIRQKRRLLPSAAPTDPLLLIDLASNSKKPEISGAQQGKRLWRRWFALVTIGEVLGFAAPAAAAVTIGQIDSTLAAVTMLMAGLVEGAVLGWFQARVLHSAIPDLDTRRWILATALGALTAWTVAIALMASNGLQGWPTAAAIPVLASGALVIIFSLGVPQWFVLRDHLAEADGWIGASAAGWIAGLLACTIVTSPLWQPGQSRAVTLAIGLVGAMVMAAAMAAVTGSYLVWLLRAQPHHPSRIAQR